MVLRRWNIAAFAAVALSMLVAGVMAVLCAVPAGHAYATSVEQLGLNYRIAVQAYEDAVVEQEENADEIVALEESIAENEEVLQQTRERLGGTVNALYRSECGHNPLLGILLGSESFHDAVRRFDLYARVERYYTDQAHAYVKERDDLAEQRVKLEALKHDIESKVAETKRAAEDAEEALRKAMHVDGEKYHQLQGNGSNCGATSFIVGVNILLNEKRYKDNVEVWAGPGFRGDSTNNLALRGKAWLKANDLGDEIGIREVKGDITTTDELREELEKGNVVVISSGAASRFQRNGNNAVPGLRDGDDGDGDDGGDDGELDDEDDESDDADDDDDDDDDDDEGDGDDDDDDAADARSRNARSGYTSSKFANTATFPDGHWIVFYHYEDGIFYANDSSVRASLGAGVPYDEEQMEQWLKGRSTHFATILYTK